MDTKKGKRKSQKNENLAHLQKSTVVTPEEILKSGSVLDLRYDTPKPIEEPQKPIEAIETNELKASEAETIEQIGQATHIEPKNILQEGPILNMRSGLDPKEVQTLLTEDENHVQNVQNIQNTKPETTEETIPEEAPIKTTGTESALDAVKISQTQDEPHPHRTLKQPVPETQSTQNQNMPSFQLLDPKSARLLFFGTPKFSAIILKKLLDEGFTIIGLVTRPDAKKGRSQELTPSDAKVIAQAHSIPIYEPKKIDETFIAQAQSFGANAFITAAYGKIMPSALLSLPRYGSINVHPSLLPLYRGASPIQNTLLSGDDITGTTIMLMDAGMDTGDVLSQQQTKIEPDELYEQLEARLAAISAKLLVKTLESWFSGQITPQKQNESRASHCQLIDKNDGKIYWNKSAQEIYNQYRAFHTWPKVYTFWKHNNQLRRVILNNLSILSDLTEEERVLEAATVFQRLDGRLAVRTGANNAVCVESLQIEGKKMQDVPEFIRGYSGFIGAKLQ